MSAVEYQWEIEDGFLKFYTGGLEYDAALIGYQSAGVSTMNVFDNSMWNGGMWDAGLWVDGVWADSAAVNPRA